MWKSAQMISFSNCLTVWHLYHLWANRAPIKKKIKFDHIVFTGSGLTEKPFDYIYSKRALLFFSILFRISLCICSAEAWRGNLTAFSSRSNTRLEAPLYIQITVHYYNVIISLFVVPFICVHIYVNEYLYTSTFPNI